MAKAKIELRVVIVNERFPAARVEARPSIHAGSTRESHKESQPDERWMENISRRSQAPIRTAGVACRSRGRCTLCGCRSDCRACVLECLRTARRTAGDDARDR